MNYLHIVKREYERIKFTQWKEHVDINITLDELGLDKDMLFINSHCYFRQHTNLHKIQLRLTEAVEYIIDENIEEKDFEKIIKKFINKKDKIFSKFTFMLVTVRPEDGKYTPNLFIEHILRCLQGRQYEMVVEQAGNTSETQGNGIHIHAILNRIDTLPVGEDKQRLFRKLTKIGNTKIDWHIEDHRQDKQNYFGKEQLTNLPVYEFNWKDSEAKNDKLSYDYTLRTQYDIPHYIEQN